MMKDAIEIKAPGFDLKPHQDRIQALLQQIDLYQHQLFEHRQKLAEAQRQLRQSHDRFHDLYEDNSVGFLTVDKKFRIETLNAKAAEILGLSPSWLVDKPFIVFIGKQDLRSFLIYASQLRHTDDREEIEVRLFTSGREVPVRISTKTRREHGLLTHLLTVVDLSEIKRTEKELQEALSNWDAVIRNTPDVIMTIQSDGTIIFANRPIWGRTPQAMVDTKLLDYVPKAERPKLLECIQQVFKSNTPASCEITGINAGKESWYSFSFSRSAIDNRVPSDPKRTPTIVVIRDVTESKRAEKHLRNSSEQLREFAARVEAVREEERTRVAREIHDELGQALTVLKLELSWVQGKTPRNQKLIRQKMGGMIRHVDDTIQRVRRIASELRPSVLDHLGLIPAIEWQFAEFRKRTGIACKLSSNIDKLDLDPDRSAAIFRVIQEGLTNVARHAEAKSVRLSLDGKNGLLQMSLADNGKGMSEAEMISSRSLGLVGMRERISRAGGNLNIQSKPGKGTRLEISIPL